jgi:hypothetical protein
VERLAPAVAHPPMGQSVVLKPGGRRYIHRRGRRPAEHGVVAIPGHIVKSSRTLAKQ